MEMLEQYHHHHHFIPFHKSYLARQRHRMQKMSRYTIAKAAHNVEQIHSTDSIIEQVHKITLHPHKFMLYEQIVIVVVYQLIDPPDQTVPLEAAHIKHTYTQTVSITVMTFSTLKSSYMKCHPGSAK
jgi:hypothetical protein